MSISYLTKENILHRVGTYDILNHYLLPYHNKACLRKGELISNPFIFPDKQQTPSFNIYPASNGHWYYKDFATEDQGSAFDLVMELRMCRFHEALEVINQDFQLGLIPSNTQRYEN